MLRTTIMLSTEIALAAYSVQINCLHSLGYLLDLQMDLYLSA